MPTTPSKVGLPTLPLIATVWALVVGGGIWALWGYEIKPGEVTTPAATWPAQATLPRSADLPTLVMTLNPNCPCSRASVEELSELMTYAHGRLTTNVVFAIPLGLTQDPATTDLWKSASAIPGVHIIRDERTIFSQSFHAGVSGQVFLYDAHGALQFHGGITSARGHEGDNEGLSAIEAFLDTGKVTRASTPVYGCSLN